jgi:hypothetical protein
MGAFVMPTVEAVELLIRMTKGEGELPDVSGLKAPAIRKLFSLSVDRETLKDFGYTHFRIIKAGEKSASLTISDGSLIGYPTLQVRLYAYPDMFQVRASAFGDQLMQISECFSYKVERDDEKFFFIDANGYTEASRVTAEMKSPEIFDEKVRAKTVEL